MISLIGLICVGVLVAALVVFAVAMYASSATSATMSEDQSIATETGTDGGGPSPETSLPLAAKVPLPELPVETSSLTPAAPETRRNDGLTAAELPPTKPGEPWNSLMSLYDDASWWSDNEISSVSDQQELRFSRSALRSPPRSFVDRYYSLLPTTLPPMSSDSEGYVYG